MTDPINVNVLVSAKEEYTNQLCYILSPLIYQGIISIFEESKNLHKSVRGISYRNFQISLANVQNWSSFITEKETKRIKASCSYLSDLVTAIFISHVKILACVRLKGEHKNIKIKIPNMETFIHKIYIIVCNKFYNNVNLINESEEIVINIISSLINECIRKQLPIEHILQEYLFDVFNNDSDSDSHSDKKSDKVFKADEVVDEEEYISDDESEFENEQKQISTIPIDGEPIQKHNEIPDFNDNETTRVEIPKSTNDTPILNPQQIESNNIPELPPNKTELFTENNSDNKRPSSPVTLFEDAQDY